MGAVLKVVSSVVTAANSYDLTDLATVKSEHTVATGDTTLDAFFSRSITQCSLVISNYCNRIFAVEKVQDQIFLNRPYEEYELQLSRWPVTAIDSVVETASDGTATTLVSGTDFLLRAQAGQLVRIGDNGLIALWQRPIVTVQFHAGYATIPADLQDAVIRLVTARLKSRGRDPMLRSEGEPGIGQQQFWVGTQPGQKGSLAPEIAALLDNYRQPALG